VVLDHFRHLSSRLKHHAGSEDEHEAIVDLLVLTVYSDRKISQEELDALDQFDLDHADWDSGAFSVGQYLPVSVSRVRSAMDVDGGAEQMLAQVAGRLSDPSMKALALESCEAIASQQSADPRETDFVAHVREALGQTH
jgi:hypothetical protein